MKTKAEMTQEYSLILLEKMNIREPNDSGWMERIAKDAAKLANVVQAEIEKNLDKSRPDVIQEGFYNCTFSNKSDTGVLFKEWQPDWSQAPEDAYEWEMVSSDKARWVCEIMGGIDYEEAPTFKYQGNWRDSLRKRPIE